MKDTKDLFKEDIEHLNTKRKELPIFEPKPKRLNYKPFILLGIIKSITRDIWSKNNKTHILIQGIKPKNNIEIYAYNNISYYLNKNYNVGDRIECQVATKTYNNKVYYFIKYINSK